MKYIIPLLILLLGCQDIPGQRVNVTDNEVYYQDVAAVIEAWEGDSTLPVPSSACDENKVSVVFMDPIDFLDYSAHCPYIEGKPCSYYQTIGQECPYGCASSFFMIDSSPFGRRASYLLVVSPNLSEDTILSAIRHESTHWLSHCTGHESTVVNGGFPYSGADFHHRDTRLWGPTGVVTRSDSIFNQGM